MQRHNPTGTQSRLIWSLTWPQMLMLILNFLIGFADVWVAGQIDHRVQASLGIITQSMFLFLVVATAVASGAVASISQSLGSDRVLRADRYTGLCLTIAAATGLVILGVSLPLGDVLVRVMQVPDDIVPLTRYMLRIYIYTLPPYYMMIMQSAVFRARRRVLIPLFTMAVVTGINTVGDIGFGLGRWGLPQFGAAGVAWATFFSVTAGAVFGFAVLWRNGILCRRSFAPWRWVKRAAPYLFKVAVPTGCMEIVWNSGYLVLFAITAGLPENSVVALAGMAAGVRVEFLLLLPAYALNLTAGVLVGNLLGAGKVEEARRTGLRILGIGVLCIACLAAAVWPFLGSIAGFIAPDPLVQAETENYLVYNVLALPFTLTTIIMAGALAGTGATVYNLVGVGIGTWLVRIPLAYLLGHVIMGNATGVWISMLASQACQAAILFYKFNGMGWRRYAMTKTRNGE